MKSPNHLDRCIVCPKCGTKTMRKSVGEGPEYFDDKCHSYFTIEELVNEWNYDLGDFGDVLTMDGDFCQDVTNLIWERDREVIAQNMLKIFSDGFHDTQKFIEEKLISTTWFDTVSTQVIDEPQWKSIKERLEAYEMVDRMFIGIPEWSMEDNSVDTGALHA